MIPSEPSLDSARESSRDSSRKRQRRAHVPWTLINFWLDAAMLLLFLTLVFVSTVIRFIFPAATASDGWVLWNLSLDRWMELQFGLMAMMTLAIVVHLMLHWSWVCGVYFGKLRRKKGKSKLPDDGIRTIYGVGLMIVLLNLMGLLVAVAALTVRSPI